LELGRLLTSNAVACLRSIDLIEVLQFWLDGVRRRQGLGFTALSLETKRS
jgi:hypothetical protein